MIIDNFNVFCCARVPDEADAPLAVDSDAVLPLPVASQSFDAIPRNRSHVLQVFGGFEHAQFSPRHLRDIAESPTPLTMEQIPRFPGNGTSVSRGENIT